ncbi:glycoside hydrolase N-terminal domain-containing protein [Cellulomonas sp. zg-ZUI168]|nr:glycoside hydrolase N-terminal domain-containing protein [Cellulomonas fengjieae]
MLGNGELGAAVRGGVGTERLRFHLHALWPRGPATREDARPPGDVQHRNLHLPSSIASTAAPGAVARRRVAILPALPACRPSGRVREDASGAATPSTSRGPTRPWRSS